MNTTAKILIIIVTWNKKSYVLNLLNSLSALTFPSDQIDILVVDNASNDNTVNALEALYSDIHIIRHTKNMGGTGGFNAGLTWAFEQTEVQYDYLWLLDNDVVVHQNALGELVEILDTDPDIAIVGSTMMQLDHPWRINEMGAFVDRGSGELLLNRYLEEVPGWRERTLAELLAVDADLSKKLDHCPLSIDVDYVAAASLLIRTPVARQAGLWMDFFIHFDDVEWCLRIAQSGYRIVVSTKSLIWHVSAIYKVPSWVLYYDNRNILYLLDKHSSPLAVKNSIRRISKKALYYALQGKDDLAQLHLQALEDYDRHVMGKKTSSCLIRTKL